MPLSDITALLLAGGRATRMGGRDKGLIALADQPMAQHACRRLEQQCAQVLINANRHIEDYQALGYSVVQDEDCTAFAGPLAGMLAGLRTADTTWLLTCPCDSPLIAADYAERMLAATHRSGATIAVARSHGRMQPVFALLQVALMPDLAATVAQGERKIDRWYAQHPVIEVDFHDRETMFLNANTPDDLVELEHHLQDLS